MGHSFYMDTYYQLPEEKKKQMYLNFRRSFLMNKIGRSFLRTAGSLLLNLAPKQAPATGWKQKTPPWGAMGMRGFSLMMFRFHVNMLLLNEPVTTT